MYIQDIQALAVFPFSPNLWCLKSWCPCLVWEFVIQSALDIFDRNHQVQTSLIPLPASPSPPSPSRWKADAFWCLSQLLAEAQAPKPCVFEGLKHRIFVRWSSGKILRLLLAIQVSLGGWSLHYNAINSIYIYVYTYVCIYSLQMAIICREVHLCFIKVRLIEEFPNKTAKLNSFTRVFQILRIWSSSNCSSGWHRRQFLGTMPWLHRYRDNWYEANFQVL